VVHNHHSQYNKAWGLEWVADAVYDGDMDDETLEEHIRKLIDEQSRE
jgi:hypothetical protein